EGRRALRPREPGGRASRRPTHLCGGKPAPPRLHAPGRARPDRAAALRARALARPRQAADTVDRYGPRRPAPRPALGPADLRRLPGFGVGGQPARLGPAAPRARADDQGGHAVRPRLGGHTRRPVAGILLPPAPRP